MSANQTYVYLCRVGRDADAMLCTFDYVARRASIEYLPSAQFEDGLLKKKILSKAAQSTLPDWLTPIVDRASDPSDTFSLCEYKKKHERLVDTRHKKIEHLLDKTDSILDGVGPEKEVKKHARTHGYHELRTCFDFFVVVAYRGTKWALLPRAFNKGTYERKVTQDSQKIGPKYKDKGCNFGWARSEDMSQQIYLAYDKYSGPGISLPEIYRKAMPKTFGCRTRRIGPTRREFYHPKSEPIPSFRQFECAIYAHYGYDAVRTKKSGEQQVRKKQRSSKGTFTSNVSNILERIEADGYFLPEVPKGERDGNPMPPLCVVRIRDLVSGIFCGIGFSIGGETADAYRSALFSMCLKKSEFGRLMGVDIDDSDWPVIGLPSWFSVDRGPGSSEELFRDLCDDLVFRDIAPSYAGQSKASIESTNPRNFKVSGAPTYIESDLTYTQLAQREISRTVRDCAGIDVSGRLTPDMLRAGVEGNSVSIFNYLNERFRNDSRPVLFEDAIRNFLPKLEVTINSTGAYLHKQHYDSTDLRATGVLDRAVRSGTLKMAAHTIPLCVRQLWADINGKIVECRAMLKIRDDDGQLYISLSDLQELEQLRLAIARADAESRHALHAEFESRFEKLAGNTWDAGKRRKGRPKRGSVESQEEFRGTKKLATGK